MTVERAALVEYWPLVDVGKLALKPGDTVILRTLKPITAEQAQRIRESFTQHFPDMAGVVVSADIDFIVKRPMPDMRAEDLVQPVRRTTME
jgi:hypothetical protein